MISSPQSPLAVDEFIDCLRARWNATYDVRLVVRGDRLYLQIMWAYLEQQSFPLDEDEYRKNLNNLLEIINRLGLSNYVREWIRSTPKKPRIGKAPTLYLKADQRLKEFLL